MTTLTRNLTQIDGANVAAPTQNGFSATSLEVFANDAAYEAVYGAGQQGDKYFNSTELLEREHDGTGWVYVNKALTATTDSSTTGADNDLAATRFDLLRFTEGSLTSIRSIDPAQHKILYMVNDQAGTQTITWNNEDGAATAANRIVTGTGDNVIQEVGQTLVMVYDSEASRWRIAGGTGSGGGGLEIEVVTNAESPVTGEIGKWYVTDTSSGEININLPDISAIPSSQQANAAIRVSDCKNNWHINKVTLTPFSGDSIDGNATDEVMDLDVEGQYVWVAREAATSWCFDTNIQPTETGATGTGGSGKNYILNPDAASGTSDVVGDAGFTVALTTAAGELAEESKETGFKISGSGLTAGTSKVAWAIEATGIDDADGGIFGRCIFRVLDISGSINGETTIQVYNVTQSAYVGDSDTITGTGTYYLDVPLVATEVYEAHLIAVGTTVSNIGISGVTIEPVSQTWANLGGWKSYDESEVTITGTNSWSTTNAQITPYKDPVTDKWFARGNIRGTTSSATGSTVTVTGMTFPAWNQAGTVSTNTTASANECYAIASTSNFKIEQGASRTAWWFSFDVELASKPTWADWDNTAPTASDVQYESTYSEYSGLSTTSTSAGVYTLMKFDTLILDSGGDYNSSTGVFTVPVTGKYHFDTRVEVNAPLGSTEYLGLVLKSGDTGTSGTGIISDAWEYGGDHRIRNSDTLYLSAGDTISIHCYTSGAETLVDQASKARLAISKLSDYSARKASLPFSDNANDTKGYYLQDIQTTTLTLDSGFTGGNREIIVTRNGDVCEIVGKGQATFASGTTISTSAGFLPTWARPTNTDTFWSNVSITGGTHQRTYVRTGGAVEINLDAARTTTATNLYAKYYVGD